MLRRFFFQLVRLNQSRFLGRLWLSFSSVTYSLPGPIVRRVTDEIQPSFPIRQSESLPSLQIVIACSSKDFEVLPATVQISSRHVLNPIDSVTVVVPDTKTEKVPELGTSVKVYGEEELVPQELIEAIRKNHPPGRYGWILQQIIGLYATWSSDSAGVLVLDSDTVLTRRRAFLQGGRRQLLSFSHEYYQPYEEHATRVWGARKRNYGLSYVTHHQLMQPWVLREMFPQVENMVSWVLAASTERKSPIADYHSYGRWLSDNYPEYVLHARWGNKSVPRRSFGSLEPQALEKEIMERFPSYFSVSLHSYLSKKSSTKPLD